MTEKQLENKIKKVLKKIRPYIQADGGDVEFADFDKKSGCLRVKFQGACVGCPMSQVTLQAGIGQMVQEEIPEVVEVVAV